MAEIELIFSPVWFYGRDIIIDIVSVVVLAFIIFFSIKSYKITKNKNYLYLCGSFFLLLLSFLFKILMNFTIYNEIVDTRHVGFATLTSERIISSDNLYFAGFLLYRIFTLVGLYLLYSIYHKKDLLDMLYVFLLIVLSMYYSHSSYYIFHILTFILLFLITTQYFKNYKENKHKNTKLLAFSFLIIMLSQIISIFIEVELLLYVIAEFIQLLGYCLLLLTFIMVLRYGKKKIQD
jgi:hypothetical protein